jgi:galactokinase
MNSARKSRLVNTFVDKFSLPASVICHAPGRVNLIGDHTDYNNGFVLPIAINVGTDIAASARSDRLIRVIALDLSTTLVEFSLDDIYFDDVATWSNYVRGTLQALMTLFPDINGADLLVSGNVPQGAGLSSSASFEIALLKVFSELYQLNLSGVQAALAGQRAENNFVGCNCGIMDQLISALGKAGQVMLLDCRDLSYQYARLPAELSLLIINSNVKRGLVDSAYNERRAQCEAAAKYFDKASLRDVSLDELEKARDAIECILYKRARHVITENMRTINMFASLAEKDLANISLLMAQSHQSLKDDFDVTTPETDFLVEIIANELGSNGGVRMTGGGFGGCLVALLPEKLIEQVIKVVDKKYTEHTGLIAQYYHCNAEKGAFDS